jgi:hypothetical protein
VGYENANENDLLAELNSAHLVTKKSEVRWPLLNQGRDLV